MITSGGFGAAFDILGPDVPPITTGYPGMGMAHRLEELVQEVEKGGSETSLERVLVKGFLREYHEAAGEGRNALVKAGPSRTGTVWDAVIAAAIEHACEMHDEPIPAWTQEPERFLKEPWTACRLPISRATAFWNAPAAFIRHNTFIEPRNLDERTGEKHVWAADERTTSEAVRADERETETGSCRVGETRTTSGRPLPSGPARVPLYAARSAGRRSRRYPPDDAELVPSSLASGTYQAGIRRSRT